MLGVHQKADGDFKLFCRLKDARTQRVNVEFY